MESSSNPVFNHVVRLRLVDRDAWGRVCGPSAALVFRVWRRARCEWWETAPRAASNGGGGGGGGDAEHQPSFAPDDKGSIVAAGSRFGDKLIGSAVVGLEVLRGKTHAPDGLGLREIDGWYHVLDDMQRPRGQIKVREREEGTGGFSRDAASNLEILRCSVACADSCGKRSFAGLVILPMIKSNAKGQVDGRSPATSQTS